jgi:DNA-binding transcriptional MerR regulator
MNVNIVQQAETHLRNAILRLQENYDPIEQINMSLELNQAMLDCQHASAGLRRQAVRRLRADGWTLKSIAEQTGMTHQRVSQIEQGVDRKEKASRQ